MLWHHVPNISTLLKCHRILHKKNQHYWQSIQYNLWYKDISNYLSKNSERYGKWFVFTKFLHDILTIFQSGVNAVVKLKNKAVWNSFLSSLCSDQSNMPYFLFFIYRTRAIISRSWLQAALKYKPYIRTEFSEKTLKTKKWSLKMG